VSSPTRAELRASDWALIQRLVARDETALASLYDRYSGLLCAVVTRILRDASAAEEVLQDVFYQLWRNAAQFDPSRGSLPGWLLVTARNRAISRLRRHNPGDAGGESETAHLNNIALPYSLESAAEQQQLLDRVRGAMSSLPPPQREAVGLAYFEGMTHSEIVAHTGEALGTVKTRLRSALETLRQALNP
jgi:RNA polymerase sigma-70 factor (ECF subfamily)